MQTSTGRLDNCGSPMIPEKDKPTVTDRNFHNGKADEYTKMIRQEKYFQISFRYLSDIFQISFRYLSDIFQISFRYLSDIFQISFRYLSDIFQISFRYLSDIFQISFRYLSVIFQWSFRYLSDIFQISFRYLSDIKKSTFRYLSDHSSHFEDVSDVSSFSKLGAQFWNMTYIWRGIPVVFSCLTEWSWSATFGQTLSAFGGVLPFSDKPKSALNLTQWKCVLHGSFGYLFLRSRVLNSEN